MPKKRGTADEAGTTAEENADTHRTLLSATGLWKFDGKNYKSWRYLLMLVLEAEGLDVFVNDDTAATSSANFKKANARAKLVIANALHMSHLSYAENSTTAGKLIEVLDEMYLEKGTVGRVQIRTAWQNLRMKDGEDLEAHLREFDKLTGELRSLGVNLDEQQVFDQLLMSMPRSLDVTVQILESMENCSIEVAKGKLRNQFERIRQPKDEKAPEGGQPSSSSFISYERKCFNCGKSGHIRAQCRNRRNHPESRFEKRGNLSNHARTDSEPVKCYQCGGKGHIARNCVTQKSPSDQKSSNDQKSPKQSFFSFLASSTEQSKCLADSRRRQRFVIDSGATSHYINDETLFTKSVTLKKAHVVNIFKKNISVEVSKVGSVMCSNGEHEFELGNVLYSKEFPVNLLSVKRMCRSGLSVSFRGDKVEILKDGRILIAGTGAEDDLYHIECDVKHEHLAMAAKPDETTLWHSRLGHPGITQMRKIASAIDGSLNVKDDFFCRHCVEGKQTKSPQVSIGVRSKKELELVHTDLLEIPVKSYNGSRYVLTFIDDYTGFVTIYLLQRKDEVFGSFQEYYARCKARFNRGIVEIRCDRGTEYLNERFRSLCRDKGIRIGATLGYSPKSNGRAERMNRSLLDKARTLMVASGIEEEFWPEAMLCSSFLVNRVANCHDIIPAEAWYGRKVDYSKFRTFGCNAFLFVPKEKRKNKLAERSRKFTFVGYDWNGYRLLDEETHRIVLGRDVRFEEQSVGLIDVCGDDYDSLQAADPSIKGETEMESSTWLAYLVTGGKVPDSYETAVNGDESQKWTAAIADELQAIESNEVWELAEAPNDANVLSTKWTFRLKDDETAKARLVARGFEESEELGDSEKYAPVARMTSVRTFLNLSLEVGSRIRQLDVCNAFLNGTLEKPVYITIPRGFRGDTCEFKEPVLKLKKALYGLKEAPKRWNETLNEFITSIGFKRCKIDDCVYTNGKVYLLVYVDDVLVLEKDRGQMEMVITQLRDQFKCRDLGYIKSYLGLKIETTAGTLRIGQQDMIERIAKAFGVDECNPVHSPMESKLQIDIEELKKHDRAEPKFRKLLGSLMYIMLGSRPDICFAVTFFSQFSSYADETTYGYLLRVLKYVYTTRHLRLVFNDAQGERPDLEVFVDADWANCTNSRKSFSGYAVFSRGNLIAWRTVKQSLVTLSSSDAEIVALCEAVCGALSIRNLSKEVGIQFRSIQLFEDNANCVRFVQGCTKRSKHLDIKFYFVRDLAEKGQIVVQKIDGKQQIADTLTKSLDRVDFVRFRQCLCVY